MTTQILLVVAGPTGLIMTSDNWFTSKFRVHLVLNLIGKVFTFEKIRLILLEEFHKFGIIMKKNHCLIFLF